MRSLLPFQFPSHRPPHESHALPEQRTTNRPSRFLSLAPSPALLPLLSLHQRKRRDVERPHEQKRSPSSPTLDQPPPSPSLPPKRHLDRLGFLRLLHSTFPVTVRLDGLLSESGSSRIQLFVDEEVRRLTSASDTSRQERSAIARVRSFAQSCKLLHPSPSHPSRARAGSPPSVRPKAEGASRSIRWRRRMV